MSTARKVKREQETQERRALRDQLKDRSVVNYINQQVRVKEMQVYQRGLRDGMFYENQRIVEAGRNLTYETT